MITGAHVVIYSKQAEDVRALFRDTLGLKSVDAGDGWLIFGLPPAEVAVHPSDENDVHELYLLTDDVEALVASMQARGIEAAPISNQGWGLLTQVTLPGGGRLGIYEPRHARPKGINTGKAAQKPAKRAAQKPASRTTRAVPKKRARGR